MTPNEATHTVLDKGPLMLRVAPAAALVAAALGILKYFVLAESEGGLANAPHFFLLLPILLIAAAAWGRKGATGGLIMLIVMFLVLGAITLSAIIRLGFSQQNWADSLVVFVGFPAALVGLYAATQTLLRGRRQRN